MKKVYKVVLIIILGILAVVIYKYYNIKNLNNITLPKKVFSIDSASKTYRLNIYNVDKTKDNAAVLVELEKKGSKKNIYWQPNTSWAYIVWKSEDILRELEKSGGNINKKNHEGQGVLEFAIRGDMPEKKIIKILNEEMKLGADITKETKNAVLQPWKYRWKAARCNYKVFDWVDYKLNNNIYKELTSDKKMFVDVARGAKTKATKAEAKLTDQDGNSMLMVAAGYGNQKLLKKLLLQEPNLNHKNRFGEDALLYAISKDQIRTARQLLKVGMDNQEALLKTAQTGNIKMAEQKQFMNMPKRQG